MAVDVSKLAINEKALTNVVRGAQDHIKKNPFKVDAMTIEIYLHPMELRAELCRLAIKLGRTCMYKQGNGATYRLAFYQEGQYVGLSFGYSNVKNFIQDTSVWGDDSAMLIPIRIFFNPNKVSYYQTARSKTDLNYNDVMTLLVGGLLQSHTAYTEPYKPTYLTEMLSYFSKCTAYHAMNLAYNEEVYRPAMVWKIKTADIAYDLPVPTECITTEKNAKSGNKTMHKELQGDNTYGYTILENGLIIYSKTSLAIKVMKQSVNRTYRGNTRGKVSKVVGIPLTRMFGTEKPELLDTLFDNLHYLVNKYPISRVERRFKNIDKEIPFENGKMLTQTINSLKGVAPDVIVNGTPSSKIDMILEGARVMKGQIDRHIGELPPDGSSPAKLEAYNKRQELRTPLTMTEIGNIQYLYSLPKDERLARLYKYKEKEQHTIRNAMALLSMSNHNEHAEYNCNQWQFKQRSYEALNKFMERLSFVVNNSHTDKTLDRVIDELETYTDYVDSKLNTPITTLTRSNQIALEGMSKFNKHLEDIVKVDGICTDDKYSRTDLQEFIKEIEKSEEESDINEK